MVKLHKNFSKFIHNLNTFVIYDGSIKYSLHIDSNISHQIFFAYGFKYKPTYNFPKVSSKTDKLQAML